MMFTLSLRTVWEFFHLIAPAKRRVLANALVIMALAGCNAPQSSESLPISRNLAPYWITDTQSGCKIWDSNPVPGESVVWSGACKDGFAEGHGIDRWYVDQKLMVNIETNFTGGRRHGPGHGTIILSNGDVYVGEFGVEGDRNGNGTYTSTTGVRYVGQFRDNEFDGQGTETWPDGRKYVGQFHGGFFNGQGTYTWPDGRKYVGKWHDGAKDGQGILYSSNGSIQHSGIWENNGFLESSTESSYTPQHNSLNPSPGAAEIVLVNDGGVFKVPVLVNGVIPLRFVVDSGSADVSIPADVVLTLMRTGTLSRSDFLGTQTYRLADGSTVPSETFRIRSLKVGNREIENVAGSVAPVAGSLLLGQSFLQRFNSWSIDNQRQVLLLE